MAGKSRITAQQALDAYEEHNQNMSKASESLGMSRSAYRDQLRKAQNNIGIETKDYKEIPGTEKEPKFKETKTRDTYVFECDDSRVTNVKDAIAKSGVDMLIWRVERVEVGGWDVTMKIKEDGNKDKPFRAQNQKIKVVFKRIISEKMEDAVEALMERIESISPTVELLAAPPESKNHSRALEICLMDPHFGMTCFPPMADAEWSSDMCADMVEQTLSELVKLAEAYGPFDEIILPIGNDFFNADNLNNTTTRGTAQPESVSYMHTVKSGEKLMVKIIDNLKKIAPVKVYAISGNHDYVTSFMLGRIMKAYYHNDENVEVNADGSPYKFHEFGCNLIGYEHGNNIAPVRLAALMANECPDAWARTKGGYREWHLGDQHRKGTSKPSSFEEQGVSVEYLPSLTPPNEWHKIKSFNHQKRGTMAFIWDATAGPIARLQVNIDKHTNRLMGR